MTERDRLREKIAMIVLEYDGRGHPSKVRYGEVADQILNIPEICILADNQELPPIVELTLSDWEIGLTEGKRHYQQDMLKANFKRVIKEE